MGSRKGIKAGRAYVELGVDDKIARGLRRAQARLKAFGAAITAAGLKLAGLGAAMVAPLLGASKAFASMGDNIAKMSQRTGMGVSALSELLFVASQTGTGIEAMEKSLGRMQRSIYDAGRGLSTAVDGFADLGLTFKDLDGLAPEQQFKLMADRISQVEDPSKKAAIAMTLLGRSGTALLPMFARGAAGIEELQKKARKLGLTMSREDTDAAVRLTDAMDSLWKVLKMGVFRVGAALAPLLERLSKKIAEVAASVNTWIQANRGMIMSILKIGAAVLAGGVALVVLGGVISGLGAAMGVLATIVAGVGTALAVMKAALLAILTPVGLVVTAVVGLGAYIIYATGMAGKALMWLGNRFDSLKSDAIDAYTGISDAMTAGDIGLAAKILWLTLKKQWLAGTAGLRKTWADMWFGIRSLQEVAVHGITKSILNSVTVWRKAVNWNRGYVADTATTLRMINRELLVDYKSLTGEYSKEKADSERQKIRLLAEGEFSKTELEKNAALATAEKLHRRQVEYAEQLHKRNLAAIAGESRAKLDAIDAEIAETEKARRAAIAAAARKKKDKTEGADPLDKAKDFFEGIGDVLARATVGVAGTFYASRAQGMGAGGAADRTAKATEQIVKINEKILTEARQGGSVFA